MLSLEHGLRPCQTTVEFCISPKVIEIGYKVWTTTLQS